MRRDGVEEGVATSHPLGLVDGAADSEVDGVRVFDGEVAEDGEPLLDMTGVCVTEEVGVTGASELEGLRDRDLCAEGDGLGVRLSLGPRDGEAAGDGVEVEDGDVVGVDDREDPGVEESEGTGETLGEVEREDAAEVLGNGDSLAAGVLEGVRVRVGEVEWVAVLEGSGEAVGLALRTPHTPPMG